MSEPTQEAETENLLIRGTGSGPEKEEKPAPNYDASAKNKFELTVRENGLKYDVAHVFGELTDERYVKWMKDFNVRGTEENVDEDSREAACKLWDDIIERVEGVEFEEGDWKSFVPYREKVEAVNQLMAVAIFEDDEAKPAVGKLRLGPASGNVKVITEAWFNGEIAQQTHELRPVTLELEKKYARIQGRRFKQEQAKGFRKKQKVTYVVQDDKIGELYDEMKISFTGFAGDVIPLRFKTAVMHEIFASPVEAKK